MWTGGTHGRRDLDDGDAFRVGQGIENALHIIPFAQGADRAMGDALAA